MRSARYSVAFVPRVRDACKLTSRTPVVPSATQGPRPPRCAGTRTPSPSARGRVRGTGRSRTGACASSSCSPATPASSSASPAMPAGRSRPTPTWPSPVSTARQPGPHPRPRTPGLAHVAHAENSPTRPAPWGTWTGQWPEVTAEESHASAHLNLSLSHPHFAKHGRCQLVSAPKHRGGENLPFSWTEPQGRLS